MSPVSTGQNQTPAQKSLQRNGSQRQDDAPVHPPKPPWMGIPSFQNTLSGVSSHMKTCDGNSNKFRFSTPCSPSSFSFAAKVLQPQKESKVPLFATTAFGQPPLGFRGLKLEQNPARRVEDKESLLDSSFGRYVKEMEQKRNSVEPTANQENSSQRKDSQSQGDAPVHPLKPPLMGISLFQNTLSDVSSQIKTFGENSSKVRFSQPANPLNTGSTFLSIPSSPSSFSFAAKVPQPQKEAKLPLFATAAFGQPPLGFVSPTFEKKTERRVESKHSLPLSDFEKYVKRMERKRKYVEPSANQENIFQSKDYQSEDDGPMHPPKRPRTDAEVPVAPPRAHAYERHILGKEIKAGANKEMLKLSEVSMEEKLRPGSHLVTPLQKPHPRSAGDSTLLTKGSLLEGGVNIERPVITLPSSLQHLIGQIAETAEEKYRLLEQRDKILRQLRPKRTLLDLSKVFEGTCPDMCPEKERYMRETHNQLSIFELIPDTEKVDHCAAIKEYSRSSADQEEPLPHELRPLPVLSMTMDYLVTQILDQGDGNYRDWYDFVWNRTRGIRKDITQQHLCDPKAVSLIEKCTRFHIHCAHHLCQEPMMSFDAKINNENMTQCLQSLKEMYQDLATKEVFCPHEAEFRQYSVLLKLNDGDILREVQQFRKEVRDSPEVKFAVQAFAALNSNNFVRFFRLVRAATYLAACILHRYFNQVRRAALKAINVAYTVSSQRPTAFPIEDMVRMLMFRNASEALDFLQQYGLSVTDGMIELSRIAYQEPDLPLPHKKSVVIEMRAMLIGEVVNGGPLPNPPQYRPVCSFDSNNKYVGDTASIEPLSTAVKVGAHCYRWNAKLLKDTDPRCQIKPKLLAEPRLCAQPFALNEQAQLKDTEETRETIQSIVQGLDPQVTFKPIFQPQPVRPPSSPPKQEPAYTDQDLMAVVETVVEDVLEAEVLGIAKAGAEYVSAALRLALLEKAACLARCTEEVCNDLMVETLDVEITQIVKEMMDVELRRIHKFIKRWRDVVAVRRQLKSQMRSFPAAPCYVDPRFKLKALVPSAPSVPSIDNLSKGFINLGNSGNMVVSCTRLLKTRNENFHQMRVDFYYNLLMSEHMWTPLDLPTLVAKYTPSPSDRIFWKAALLLPSSQGYDMSFTNSTLTKWLKVKLGGGERMEESMSEMEGKLETLYVSNSLRCIGQKTHKVHLCMKVTHGPLNEEGQNQLEEQKGLQGTNALVMVLPPLISLEQEEEDVPLLSALLQLKQVQQASGWNTALPLALIIPVQLEGAFTEQKLEEVLMLKTLVEDGLISEYISVHVSGSISDLHGSQQIGEALQWLVAHSPASPVLTSQPLLQFVESGLCHEFYSRFLHDKQERVQAGLSCHEPAVITQLYNSVLHYLSDVVSSEMLSNLSWPPPEFSFPESREIVPQLEWNSPQHLAWLKRAILSLQLPNWVKPSQNASWPCLCAFIFQYVSQIPSSSLCQPILMSRLDHLLSRVHARHLQLAIENNKVKPGPSYKDVPWDDILLLCIEHKMKDWHLTEGTLAKDAITDNGDFLVYYCKDWIKDCVPSKCWVEAVKRTHREKQQASERSNVNSRLTQTPGAQHHRQIPIQNEVSPLELQLQNLLSSIEKEKAESQRFMEKLQCWLKTDPLGMISMPLFVPSTLLSVPELLVPAVCPLTSSSCHKQENRSHDRTGRTPTTLRKDTSLSQRLDDLERLILSNREEEHVFSFKLKSLVEIIED